LAVARDERKRTCIQVASYLTHRINGIPQERRRPTTFMQRKSRTLVKLPFSRAVSEFMTWR